VPAKKSGLRLEGEIRDMVELKTLDGKILVIARNNDKPQVFKLTNRP
jgi:hypothetical protein